MKPILPIGSLVNAFSLQLLLFEVAEASPGRLILFFFFFVASTTAIGDYPSLPTYSFQKVSKTQHLNIYRWLIMHKHISSIHFYKWSNEKSETRPSVIWQDTDGGIYVTNSKCYVNAGTELVMAFMKEHNKKGFA